MPYFTLKYVIFSTLFKTRTTVLKETNDKKYVSNGVAHSLYLVIELNSNKQIKIIISKFTFVCLFSFSSKCHVCLTLVIKMTKVRKNGKLVTVTSLVRCAILDTCSALECSTSPYFRPIRVKSIRTI